MTTKRMTWFRFYAEAIEDPKVQRLAPHLFKTWVNLLCLASQGGGKLPNYDDVAFKLRLSTQDAEQQISDLVLASLIDIGPCGELTPHNWNARQFVSDSSTERVRKHRETHDKKPRNVSCNVSVTPPDTEADTETEAETEQKTVSVAQKTKNTGTRLPVAWQLPDDWRSWARVSFAHSTAETVQFQADSFRDFWIAKAGAGGRKADWEATWRNWCRRAFATAPIRPMSQPLPRSKPTLREIMAMEARGEIVI